MVHLLNYLTNFGSLMTSLVLVKNSSDFWRTRLCTNAPEQNETNKSREYFFKNVDGFFLSHFKSDFAPMFSFTLFATCRESFKYLIFAKFKLVIQCRCSHRLQNCVPQMPPEAQIFLIIVPLKVLNIISLAETSEGGSRVYELLRQTCAHKV